MLFKYLHSKCRRRDIKQDMHSSKMVSVNMRNDLQELTQFLGKHGVYLRGHPFAADVNAFRLAVDNVVANMQVVPALEAIHTAVREGGWLMQVLVSHTADAECARAMQLCLQVSESLQFVTHSSPAPSWSLTGQWKDLPVPLSAPETIPIWNELNRYSEIMSSLSKYIFHVMHHIPFTTQHELPPTCQQHVHTLNNMFAEFPTASQLLRMIFSRLRPEGTLLYVYQTSYVEFSGTNNFSRTMLLAHLPALMAQLEQCNRTLTLLSTDSLRLQADQIFKSCKDAYEAWQALAANELQRSFGVSHLQKREQTGQKRASMRKMLAALQDLTGSEL